jgi:hypothetical protein
MTDPMRRAHRRCKSGRSSPARAKNSARRSRFSRGPPGLKPLLPHSRVALEPEGEARPISGRPARNQTSRRTPAAASARRSGLRTLRASCPWRARRHWRPHRQPRCWDHLLRHDRLEADPEVLLLRDAVGLFGHEPDHALGAAIAAPHRRSVFLDGHSPRPSGRRSGVAIVRASASSRRSPGLWRRRESLREHRGGPRRGEPAPLPKRQ